MSDETIEVLQAKLEALKKENIERELAAEKKKAEDALKEAEEVERLQIAKEAVEAYKKEQIVELAEESHITSGEPEKLVGKSSKFITFLSKWGDNHKLKGTSYEDTIKNVCNKGGY